MMYRIALLLLGLALAGTAAAEGSAIRSIRIGGNIDVTAPVDGPEILIGGTVKVDAPVNGTLHAAGGTVELGPAAPIWGDAFIAAGKVNVSGPVNGDLGVAAGQVRIDGQVTGDADIAAGTLELGPGARIEGQLDFHGDKLRRDPGAQVLGHVQHWHGEHHEHQVTREETAAERFARGWLWTIGLMVLAALIAAALPGASARMAAELRERPWITPLVGLVALSTIPIAALLLMITIIGIPIALLGLAGYGALLLVGYVWLTVVVGAMLLDRIRPDTAALTGWRMGAAVLAMLVLGLLVRVPIVGGLFRLAALVVGVGMIVATLFRPHHAAS